MTPLFCWVFLLALVGRAASVPSPLVNDACALVCNPGAETEGERERRERDPVQYPRYPKGVCKLQSSSDQDQARVIVSHCLKLCANELTDATELNCFVLRSSIESHLGCYCPPLMPLSPNTMRLHENWRITHLVGELAQDVVDTIFHSPIEQSVICELHQEIFLESAKTAGTIGDKCRAQDTQDKDKDSQRAKRDADDTIFMEKVKSSFQNKDTAANIKTEESPRKAEDKPEKPEKPQMKFEIEEDRLRDRESAIKDHMEFMRMCEQSCQTEEPDNSCDCDNIGRMGSI